MDHGHGAGHQHGDAAGHRAGRGVDARGILKGAKLRVTGVRLDVLAVLAESGQALNAQQVYDAVAARGGGDASPDRVTVYRTLNALVDAGAAHKVDPGDRVFRFRLTDHAHCDGHHHDHEHPHFVCDDCGTVECLEGAKVQITPGPETSAGHGARAGKGGAGVGGGAGGVGRRTVRPDVVLHGTCASCGDEDARREEVGAAGGGNAAHAAGAAGKGDGTPRGKPGAKSAGAGKKKTTRRG